MFRTSSRGPRLALCAAVAALLAAAPGAQAADPSSSTACTTSTQSFSQVFNRSPWYDPASYTLSPGAGMESAMTGWTFSGGAAITAGNESFSVGGATDRRSLALPNGSSTTSAPICVGLNYPDMRFFVRNTGAATGRLTVEIRTVSALGLVTSLAPTTVLASSSWQLSPPVLLVANAAALLNRDGLTPISIRFTPAGGTWQIDDVYVDPYRSR